MSADVTAELIHALIENMKGARDDWASLAMVIDLRAGRVSGTHGYAYSPDGTVSAVASRPSGVRPALEAYLESHDQPGQEPVKILVQLSRASGTYEVTFEDDDAARWKVTRRTSSRSARSRARTSSEQTGPMSEVVYAVEERGWIPKVIREGDQLQLIMGIDPTVAMTSASSSSRSTRSTSPFSVPASPVT